jgi:hypothetical protein
MELIKPIKAESKKEHERELEKRLAYIQLDYAKYIFDNKNADGLRYFDVLSKFTAVVNTYIASDANEEFKVSIDRTFMEGEEGWRDRILNIIHATYPPHEIGEYDGSDSGRSAISYHVWENQDLNYEGIDRSYAGMDIHLTKAYLVDLKVSHERLRQEFGKLAVTIIDKYPHVRYVMGRSWIMDHPLMRKIGFKVLDRYASLDHESTWWQLIDKDGQINNTVLERLRSTGKLPFEVVLAFMPVEEFLAKFLPNERRGRIVLEDRAYDPALTEAREKSQARREEFIRQYLSLNVDELENYFLGYRDMEYFISTDVGQKLFAYLRMKHGQGIKFEDFKDSKDFEDISKDAERIIDEYYRSRQTIVKREVVIE